MPTIPRLLTVLLVALLVPAAGAATMPGVPAPPQLDAAAYVLIDAASGETLAEHNADQRIEPASMTKIMTVYVAAAELARGAIKLEDQVLVSERAWRMEGSKMFIEVGKRVSVSDLLHGVIVQSGNDASVALAEHIAGDESVFAAMMNEHAARLGLQGTHFSNSTGWPDPQTYSTARDLARLGVALIRDHPDIYAWFAIRDFTFNGIRQGNRNSLLDADPSADGIKTGHTEAAGYCLVAAALRDGMRLVSVVAGSASDRARTQASQALLNYGFRFYETHKLYDAGQALTDARIWKGAQDTVPLGLPAPLHLTVPRGRYQELEVAVELAGPLLAPVAPGERHGEVRFSLGGTELKRLPLEPLQAVPAGGWLGRSWDALLLLFGAD